MFVRSRPPRIRPERPVPGDRVLDAFDLALIGAHGAALDLVAVYLNRAGIVEAHEFRRSESYRRRYTWRLGRIILDNADGRGLARCKPSGGAAGSRG